MESSPLNNAHLFSRKTERCLKVLNFDLALENLEISIKNFDLALKQTTIPKVVESIKLQKEYHIKQRELINYKKTHYEKYNLLTQKLNTSETDVENFQINERLENSNKIQLQIFKNIDTADLALEQFLMQNSDDNNISTASELQALNQKLHLLIQQNFIQQDLTLQENDALKLRIKSLEQDVSEKRKEKKMEGYKIHDEYLDTFSPDAIEALEELPSLAPLELPSFDLETLGGTSKD
ncbi:unnamed protein product [Diamesa hyperborea]